MEFLQGLGVIVAVRTLKYLCGWSCSGDQTVDHFSGDRVSNFCIPYSLISQLIESRSTRNVRIERTWGEAGSQFVRQWRTFFIRLEQLHRLDVTKPGHIWLIHILFLTEINEDCKNFQEMWNHHPISRVGHDQTPKVCFYRSFYKKIPLIFYI